mmetsp:Transcript_7766/g.24908  ORF Transcript_7766/g.24908 Transcript_7766/m.24908 type:complete len:455 (-) Transcript_7766:885-2249(-)
MSSSVFINGIPITPPTAPNKLNVYSLFFRSPHLCLLELGAKGHVCRVVPVDPLTGDVLDELVVGSHYLCMESDGGQLAAASGTSDLPASAPEVCSHCSKEKVEAKIKDIETKKERWLCLKCAREMMDLQSEDERKMYHQAMAELEFKANWLQEQSDALIRRHNEAMAAVGDEGKRLLIGPNDEVDLDADEVPSSGTGRNVAFINGIPFSLGSPSDVLNLYTTFGKSASMTLLEVGSTGHVRRLVKFDVQSGDVSEPLAAGRFYLLLERPGGIRPRGQTEAAVTTPDKCQKCAERPVGAKWSNQWLCIECTASVVDSANEPDRTASHATVLELEHRVTQQAKRLAALVQRTNDLLTALGGSAAAEVLREVEEEAEGDADDDADGDVDAGDGAEPEADASAPSTIDAATERAELSMRLQMVQLALDEATKGGDAVEADRAKRELTEVRQKLDALGA